MKEGLKSGLGNLQGLEFIYEKNLFPELEYIFRHALVQEVAYNSLLINRRKEIHEKIGQAIESLHPHRLEEFYEVLAYHYSRSENMLKAYEYLNLAAKKAFGKDALIEAVRFYKEAMAWVSAMKTHDSAQSRFARESTAIIKNRRVSTEFTALQRGAEGQKPPSVKESSAFLGCRSGVRQPHLI
jgi:predicted ATPase